MQAIIERKDGSIDTRVFGSTTGHTAVGMLIDDDRPENHMTKIWFVLDEIGETWNEDQDPYWTADEANFVFIQRKTDGCLARLTLPYTAEDAWTEICKQYPRSEALLDEHSIQWIEDCDERTSGLDSSVAVRYGPDEDGELAVWLAQWTAEAVELDVGIERIIGEAVDYPTKELAVRRAEDLADEWINRQACDLAELVVVVRVGGEDVRCYENGEWDDVE